MRCFLAVEIPEELKKKIITVQSELLGYDTKLAEKNNLHFTLKFLGEIDEPSMKNVMNKISQMKWQSCSVHLQGIGFFPDSKFIRVVWAGANSNEFLDLHMKTEKALEGMFPKENPIPHLTLARVSTQKYKEALLAFQKRHENEDFGQFEAIQIKLKKSILTRNGPVYSDIASWDNDDNR